MSCGCDGTSPFGNNTAYQNVCNADIPYPQVSPESVPSLISNLTKALYGEITKDASSGSVVWNIPCDPNSTAQVPGLARGATEGLMCYMLRSMQVSMPVYFTGTPKAFTPTDTRVFWALTAAAAGTAVTLPPLYSGSNISRCSPIGLYNACEFPITINTTTGNYIAPSYDAAASTFVLQPRDTIELTGVADTTSGIWFVTGGNATLYTTSEFKYGTGYQFFPTGLLLQWGTATCNPAQTTLTQFPIAFPTAVVGIFFEKAAYGAFAGLKYLSSFYSGSLTTNVVSNYVAIGY